MGQCRGESESESFMVAGWLAGLLFSFASVAGSDAACSMLGFWSWILDLALGS